jgi:hypothetical protein
VNTGRTFPTGVGAPALLEIVRMIGRVRPIPAHPQNSSIAPPMEQPYFVPWMHSESSLMTRRGPRTPEQPDR